jgi:hypothetical protein
MAWGGDSAEALIEDAERRKEGKVAKDFKREFRHCEVGDLVTLLMAGGELVENNIDLQFERGYRVKLQGYTFEARTVQPLPSGIVDRDYSQNE